MARYLIGDVLEVAATLEPDSVDLIVSSPPFLAVRSYLPADHPLKALEGGQQSTPGEYIDWLLDVVEALAPALAPHGSLVFELGDTYAGSGGGGGDYYDGGLKAGQPGFTGSAQADRDALREANAAHWRQKNAPILDSSAKWDRNTKQYPGNPPSRPKYPDAGGNGWPRAKSKSLIPELFRLALTYGLNPLTGRQTERWILRNVITWCRPNPTPGALGDKVRPATSDIAVLTKNPKRWFDLDAERQPHKRIQDMSTWMRHDTGSRGDDGKGYTAPMHPAGAPLLDWWELPPEQPTPGRMTRDALKGPNSDRGDEGRSYFGGDGNAPPLDFWVLPPGGYSGAHYAVWPPELVRRLINLMCPIRVCRVCGEPSRRVTETVNAVGHAAHSSAWLAGADPRDERRVGAARPAFGADVRTLGWSDCGHDDWRDGRVLDPFVGSGTTLAVASGMGRESIGIDLDERNLELARARVGMFLEEV